MTLRGRVQVMLAAAVSPLATLLVLDGYHDGRRLALIGVLTALALGAGWLAGRHLVERPLQHLLAVAQRRAAGDLKARFRAGPPTSEFARLGLALNDTAAAFDRLLDQRALLAGEVQHRVMNSLHLLGAILHLHARQVDSETARQHLNEARERVASMSIVYRHLHEGASLQSVDFRMVLRDICQETGDACCLGEGQGTVETAADAVELPVDTAMNLALIAHELIASAGKHAHRRAGGRLRVELAARRGVVELAVTTWGKGPPPDLTLERSRSLGMLVIQSLTRQLRGRCSAESRRGETRLSVAVPMPALPASDPDTRDGEKLVA